MKGNKIFVHYFVQNDPWESISEPNLFVLPGEYPNLNEVRAEQVYNSLPLKNYYSFYLRFFLDDKSQNLKVWMDYPPSATIPVYKGGHVFAKVLRLPKGTQINFKNKEMFKKVQEVNQSESSKSPNEQGQNKRQVESPTLINLQEIDNRINSNGPKGASGKGETVTNKIPSKINLTDEKNSSENNFKGGPDFSIPEHLDLNKIISEGLKDSSQVNQQPINSRKKIEEEPIKGNSINQNDKKRIFLVDNPIQEDKQKSKIHSTLEELFVNPKNEPIPPNVNFILSNAKLNIPQGGKITYDKVENIPSNLPEEDIKEKVDIIIQKWSMGLNEKKNLVYLLSTLHQIWKDDTSWIEVSMEQLVNDKKYVRKMYKKAMLQLHADKTKDKDFKTQYIAKSLYQLLNEANSAFS